MIPLSLDRFRRTYAVSLDFVPTRDELPRVLAERGLADGVAVEVGVQRGEYSRHLLTECPRLTLISVDPWRGDVDGYDDPANVSQAEQDRRYGATKDALAPFGARSDIWRMTSVDGAAAVRGMAYREPVPRLLALPGFVYLDARHDEASVAEDIAAWWPLVRSGGILAGHDFLDGDVTDTATGKVHRFGVASAVLAFARAEGVEVACTFADRPFISWMVAKPCATP